MEWSEIGYIGLGIVATLIASLILKIIEHNTNKLGKVEIYCRVIELAENNIEMKIEIKNSTNDVAFIRQLSLFEEINGTLISAIPLTHSQDLKSKEISYFADEGFYSFAIPQKSIKHYHLMFGIKQHENNTNTNMLLEYYNNKDKLIKLTFDKNNDMWQSLYRKK